MLLTNLATLNSNLLSDLSQDVRFLSNSIIYMFHKYGSEIGHPMLKITQLNRIIVLVGDLWKNRHCG